MFSSNLNSCLVLVLIAFLAYETNACGNVRKFLKAHKDYSPPSSYKPCGKCGKPISVTFTLLNIMVPPTFEVEITVEHRERELIFFLEKAAQMNKTFEFTAKYYSQWGYFLNSIGGQASDPANSLYWMFYSHGKLLDKGLSSYIPHDDQHILFNFTDVGHT